MASANTVRKMPRLGEDLYNTPVEAIESAWYGGVFRDFKSYFDPCNGLGEISDFLKSKGKIVATADIVDYGCQDDVIDFLESVHCKGMGCIVMNPPFLLTEEFVTHALNICPNLIMFNRASVLETADRSQNHTSKKWPLKTFYSLANRVSCSEGVDRKATSNSVWYGWFRYERGYYADPSIKWLFTK